MKKVFAGLVGLMMPWQAMAAQNDTKPIPPGTPVTITVIPVAPASSGLSINLGSRHGHVTPSQCGKAHMGSGYIDIQQPTTDTAVITMTGVAVAYGCCCDGGSATVDFDLCQDFEVAFDKPEIKKAKMTIEGRVIGARSHCPCCSKKGGGSAEESGGCIHVTANEPEGKFTLSLCLPDHSVCCGENLSINDHEGTVDAPVVAGKYTLKQCFHIGAHAPKSVLPCKAPSAEFAPDPALDPLWISYWEPFHGIAKKDFGLQIIVKLVDDTASAAPEKKEVAPPADVKPAK